MKVAKLAKLQGGPQLWSVVPLWEMDDTRWKWVAPGSYFPPGRSEAYNHNAMRKVVNSNWIRHQQSQVEERSMCS